MPAHHRGLCGHAGRTHRDILDRLAFIKGNQFARAALDITWWVLDAKRRGLPLHRALGGSADRVAVGADFGIQDSLDLLLEKIQGAVDAVRDVSFQLHKGETIAIVGEAPTGPDFREGWEVQKVVDAVIQSSRERQWVRLA